MNIEFAEPAVTLIAETTLTQAVVFEVALASEEGDQTVSVRGLELYPVVQEFMDVQEDSSDGATVLTFAGRECYDSAHRPNPATANDADYLLSTLFEKKHFSIAEHAHFTVKVDGFSRAFTHEHVRHRHFNYSQLSQRFVSEKSFRIAPHPSLTEEQRQALRDSVAADLFQYRKAVEDAQKAGQTRKQAREAARAFLPNAMEAPIVITGNVRSWVEMINRRIRPDADAEIQLYARLALEALHLALPEVFIPFILILEREGVRTGFSPEEIEEFSGDYEGKEIFDV